MTPSSSAWRTLVLTSVAVFAVSLDGTVLFVAFPAIRATSRTSPPPSSPGSSTRTPSCSGRCSCRPDGRRSRRPQAHLPARPRPLQRRLRALRRGTLARHVDRGPRAPGPRRRAPLAFFARARAPRLPGGAPCEGGGPLGSGRCAGGGDRPVARVAHHPVLGLAVGLLHQRPGRHRRRGPRQQTAPRVARRSGE